MFYRREYNNSISTEETETYFPSDVANLSDFNEFFRLCLHGLIETELLWNLNAMDTREAVSQALDSFSHEPERFLFTASTLPGEQVSDDDDVSEALTRDYQYSVVGADSSRREITLVDPRRVSLWETIVLSYDAFLRQFACLAGVKIRLRNISETERQYASRTDSAVRQYVNAFSVQISPQLFHFRENSFVV